MPYKRSATNFTVLWLLGMVLGALLTFVSTAFGQQSSPLPILEEGSVAPFKGIIFNDALARRLVEDLRDLKVLRAVVETQQAELAAKDAEIATLKTQVAELKEAARQQEVTYARMEERDKLRQENQDGMKTVLLETRQTLVETRGVLKEIMEQNRALHRELFWTRLLGPLGILIGAFVGGL